MGEPLLLLPGAFSDRRLFAHQLDHLGDVAATRFVDLPDEATVAAMAERVLAAAPARFALLGLSLGGIVAFELLRRAPERVSRLALLATTADPDPPAVTALRRTAIARVRAGALAAQVDAMAPMLLSPHARTRPAVGATAKAMALGVGAERYARQVEAVMTRPDQRPLPAAITCPTLVLCGRDDAVTSLERHRTLADAIATSRLAVVEQAGHLVSLEQPVATTALLRDWLLYAV